MNKHTLNLLEFRKIVETVKGYCFSPQGADLLESQRIGTEADRIEEGKLLTMAFRKLMESGEKIPYFNFPDISPYYKQLVKKGSFLEPKEFLDIGNYLLSAKALKRFICKKSESSALIGEAEKLEDQDFVIKEIFTLVDKKGEVREGRIPELVKIKKEMNRLTGDVNKLTRSYLNNPAYRTYWQTDNITFRDGRVLLPLKANFKGRIKGVVHEVSSSGATVFLEPFDIVEKNNKIIGLEGEYRKVLIKYLQELTSLIIDYFEDIKFTAERVAFLDTYWARGAYGLKNECRMAGFSTKKIELLGARHPLLGKNVVPIDVKISDDVRVLIITGPNTGGKTVTLKTVALFCLMNQFAMEIPAREGSCLPVFRQVLADIGDEQSIEQSLSTFSAHIRNMSNIIRQSTSDSLVLLDELGAGTDPEEGVAIAMSLLDHFIDKGATVLSTTHHGILKNYGYTKDGVENASMDFDDKTLNPCYRLIMGVPGESHALSIAGHHGIPKKLIQNARAYLNDERSDISGLINKLTEKQRKLFEVEKSHEMKKMELDEKARMADLKALRLKQKELELNEYNLKETRRFLSEARQNVENMIRKMREDMKSGELSKEKIKEIHSYLGTVDDKARNEEKKLKEGLQEFYPAGDVVLKPGGKVLIKSTRREGEILRKGKGDTWVIDTGMLKVSLYPHEFEPIKVKTKQKRVEIISSEIESMTPQPVFSLKVLGMRLNEALSEVEKQIDRAVIKGMKEFYIVHGKGDGILQKGIHEYLKKNRFVVDYYFSLPEDGGFGRTIVILKS